MAMRIKEIYADTPEKFGEAIKLHRTIRGMTQVQLATQAQVTRKAVASLESGAPGTHLATVLRIMKALDMPSIMTYVGEHVDDES